MRKTRRNLGRILALAIVLTPGCTMRQKEAMSLQDRYQVLTKSGESRLRLSNSEELFGDQKIEVYESGRKIGEFNPTNSMIDLPYFPGKRKFRFRSRNRSSATLRIFLPEPQKIKNGDYIGLVEYWKD